MKQDGGAFDWSATRRLQENATFAHRVAPPKSAAHVDRCQRMMVNPERGTTIDVSPGFVELKQGSGRPIPQVPEDTGNSEQTGPWIAPSSTFSDTSVAC